LKTGWVIKSSRTGAQVRRRGSVRPLLALSFAAAATLSALWFAPRLEQSAARVPAMPVGAAASVKVAAQDPAWAKLSLSQQKALAPLRQEWPSLSDGAKQRWLAIGSRFHSMTHRAQTRIQLRMAEWSKLTPAQRAEARLKYQQAARLSVKQRRDRWEAYQRLPPDQRASTVKAAQDRVVPPASVSIGPGPRSC